MTPDPSRCQVNAALEAIVGKWKTSILLNLLFNGTMRFSELKAAIPGITQKMLTSSLRELEMQDLIQRVVYPQVPPKVEYSLTEHGLTLVPILKQLHDWGSQHIKHLEAKQENEWATGS